MLIKRIALLLSTTAAVMAGAAAGFASPVNPKDIAADSVTMVHLDWDAISASAVGQSVLSEPALQDALAEVGARFDADLGKQLHGITFYTTAGHSNEGVMLIAADFEPDKLLAKAEDLNDFHGVTNGSRVIYSWLDEKWKRREGGTARAYGAISGHYIVCGQSEARLADALDVLEGPERAVEAAKEPLYTKPGEHILLEAVVLKVDVPKAQGPAAFLQMCKSAYLKVSEANDNTTATLHLETADDDTAAKLNSMVQGLMAMLKMQGGGDTNATKLANSITITKDGLAVGVTLSMPSSDMIDLMKSGQEKAEQRRAKRRARDKDSKPSGK